MSLELIVGRSKTGKSKYLFEKIMACENNKEHAILFVPATARIMAEKQYIKYTGKKGIVDTSITALERFISKNVDKSKLYKDKTFLPELSKKLLIKKVIDENPNLFKVFTKVKETNGFIDKLYNYITTFDEVKIDSEKIEELYKENDFTKSKIVELIQIYNKVKEEVNTKFVTSTDELAFYISSINKQGIQGTNLDRVSIFFDGYNNFTKMEYSFIEAVLKAGINITIVIDLDVEQATSKTSDIFDVSNYTYNYCIKLAKKLGINLEVIKLEKSLNNTKDDISWLGKNIFDISRNLYQDKSKNIKIHLASNTYDEIKYIAKDIKKNISEKNLRYNDHIIYTNDLDTYSTAICKIFESYGIHVTIGISSDIKNSSIITYILNLLDIVLNGFGYSNQSAVINLLKTNLLEIEETDIYNFENYITEFGIKGYMFDREFTINNSKDITNNVYDLEKVNEVRKIVLRKVNMVQGKLESGLTTKEITEVIYEHLIEEKIIQNYERQMTDIHEFNIEIYNKKKQVVQSIYEVMDAICLAYSEITLEGYVNLFRYGLNDKEVSSIPAMIDEVQVCNVNKNRELAKKVVYIIGAYDGGLPNNYSNDNIFSDRELEKLKHNGIELKQSSKDKTNMELFNIYQAINRCEDSLKITLPASKMSGGSLRPSYLIQQIKNVVNVSVEGNISNQNNVEKTNLKDTFDSLLETIANSDGSMSDDEIKEAYSTYKYFYNSSFEKYKKILNYFRKDENLKTETLDLIYKDSIKSSVSRLEQFEKCPFAYYTKYILKLNEKREYNLTNIDIGSIMHFVLEMVSKYLVERDIEWTQIVADDKVKEKVRNNLDKIVDNIFGNKYEKYLKSVRYNIIKNRLKASMFKIVLAISDSFSQSAFRPLGYEIEFEDGKLFAPIEIDLQNGKKMYLRGKIDRVDSCKINEKTYLRIVDYKSSDKNLNLNDIKQGISLQLMSYMSAIIENKEKIDMSTKVVPAALTYYTISSKVLNLGNYEHDKEKINTKIRKMLKLRGIYIKDMEILENMDQKVKDSKNSYLDISSRTMNNENKLLPEDVFIEECQNIKKTLKLIAEEVVQGRVKILPNAKMKDVCAYCNYSSFCRKNIKN